MGRLQKFFRTVGIALYKGFKLCDRKLTIMIVPHSQNNVINFRTNIFSLVTGTVIVLGIIVSFFYFNQQRDTSATEITRLKDENRDTLASFDVLRDENNNLLQAAEQFKNSLNQSLALVGINLSSSQKNSNQDSDLASLFDNQTVATGSTREITDVKQLTSYMEGATQPIEQIGEMVDAQKAMFADTPNLWPVQGGIGTSTMDFGHAVHPITGKWYIHKGYDISTGRSGDPIVATANGKVVTNAFDDIFGINVTIQHKYGYLTKYAHMDASHVTLGQIVEQGEVIGTIGDTGIVTGAHLHYEIHIGASVVDPAQYINIKLSN